MKNKLMLVVLMTLILVLMSGCYYDRNIDNMKCVEIKVYNEQGQEVTGVYEDGFRWGIEGINLNSAPPVETYYVVEYDGVTTYDVVFKFYTKNAKTLKIITLTNENTKEDIKTENIAKENNYFYYATFRLENISETYKFFSLKKWNDSNFTVKGSNAYIRGVYFRNVSETKNNAC